VAFGCDPYAPVDGFYGWLKSGYCAVADHCQFDDHDVTPGVLYSYRVWALSDAKFLSAPSQVLNVNIVENP
jgi:hypothetical protein